MITAIIAAGCTTALAVAHGRATALQRLRDFRGQDFQPQRAAFRDWPAAQGQTAADRLVNLLEDAFADLMRSAQAANCCRLAAQGLHVAVVLPETEAATGLSAQDLIDIGLRRAGAAARHLNTVPIDVTCHLRGGAGLAEALMHHFPAVDKDASHSLLVLAVKSFANAPRLNALNDRGRLFSNHTPWGLIPGEGAAALFLTPQALAPTARLSITGAGLAVETVGEDDPGDSTYQGLTTACFAACEEGGLPVQTWITDYHNARYRAAEISYAVLRLGPRVTADCALLHPTTRFGDLGAAAMAIATALAWQAAIQTPAPVSTLITGTAQYARLRGAMVLRAPHPPLSP